MVILVNIVVILIIVLLLSGAVTYIVKEKKKGVKCVGCPYAKSCTRGSCTSDPKDMN